MTTEVSQIGSAISVNLPGLTVDRGIRSGTPRWSQDVGEI